MKKMTGKQQFAEFIRYLIIGFATTGINWGTTFILTQFTPLGTPGGIRATIVAVISWILSTIFFAFWAYKLFVFRSKSMKPRILWTEFAGFTGARLLTLGVELFITFAFCTLIGFDQILQITITRGSSTLLDFPLAERYIVKLGACVIVTILNYIFSKLIIFKKGQAQTLAEQDEGNEEETRA